MKHTKKFTMRLLSVTLAAVLSLFAVGGSAFAEAIIYKWGVDRSYADINDRYGWTGNGSTKFSVDSNVHTDNSWYSIKLENTDYNISYVERTYKVEPYTTYRFSAMVKYSGYALSPNVKDQESGACVGKAYTYENSGFTTSSDWTFMEYEFTTGNETTYNLALQNGIFNGDCKGTAWFSDVKLEKAEMTNSWNILVLFFKNIDATVSLNGKTVHHKKSINEAKINDINMHCLDKLPTLFSDLSDNKMTVNSIDRYYIDEILTERDLSPAEYQDKAETIPSGYRIDVRNSKVLSKAADKYLAQKHYNQIIVFVPLSGIHGNWAGLGGTEYRKSVEFAQITDRWDGAFENDNYFQGHVAVHEMTHSLERRSKAISSDKTPVFHDIYEYTRQGSSYPIVSGYEVIHQYYTRTLPDGRGLDPSVFYVTSGKYTLVSDDMTTGAGIEPGSSSVAPPAPKNFRAESVSDTHIKFSWDAVPKADGYQYVRFKDAEYKEMVRDPSYYKSDKFSTTWGPFTKGKPLYFGVRTLASVNGKMVYSDWTTLTYTHEGIKVVHGDIDNNGKFDLTDVYTALQIYVNDTAVDQRTLIAAGAAEKGFIDLNDILALLDDYVRS